MLNPSKLLCEANEIIQTKKITNDRYRLGYHITAPYGWMNDPNGLVYFKGEYHIFYQHHPFSSEWGPMFWGHAKSSDLVNWEHLPIALAPGEEYDKDGCFSGSAVVKGDELCLIYTGHTWIDQDKGIVHQVQCLATSKDGVHFTKHPNNPIISIVPEDSTGHFRDPKVWFANGKWQMVVGNQDKDNRGRVITYQSNNLVNWEYTGVLAKSTGNEGYMWECPDFIELDGKYVLLISPQGIEPEGDQYQNFRQTGTLIGTLNQDNEFLHSSFTELDRGHDFYAIQTFTDNQDRRIAFAWMDMWQSAMPSQKHDWSGAFTLPRELFIKKGRLAMKPVEELKQLRLKKDELNSLNITGEKILDVRGKLLEIDLTFDLSKTDAKTFGINIHRSENGIEKTIIGFDTSTSKLYLDRDHAGEGVNGIRYAKMDITDNTLHLRIFVDRSSVEVFANMGDVTMTSRVYPEENSDRLSLFSRGGSVSITSCVIWNLKDIWK